MTTNPMESTAMIEAELEPSYLDFEPYCAWHREEESDTLAVHLHGFQKEQIKVLVNNVQRALKIKGQRPFADDNTWARFAKQIKLPDGCDGLGIRAELSEGILAIKMPKKLSHELNVSTKALQQVHQPHGHEEIASDHQPINNSEEHKISDQSKNNGLIKDLGFWTTAGKVAAVVIVLAFSGAVARGIYKRRSYNAEK